VKKPLAAVHRICEKGNIVQFGPNEADNFIFDVTSKQKTWLKGVWAVCAGSNFSY